LRPITEPTSTTGKSITLPLAVAGSETSSARRSCFWHVLNFSPFLLLVWFVSRFAVNVPYIDEWNFAYLFRAVKLRQVTWNDFFALTYEHRLFFPRLVWTPLAFATHWNLRIETMVNLIPALILFLALYQLAVSQAKRGGGAMLNLANFSTGLFLFSLSQYQTWLWGEAGAYIMVQASVALAICVCCTGKLHAWARLALAAGFCFIASFSMSWGLLSWVALVPCVRLLQGGAKNNTQIYIWGFFFAAAIALYSYHYEFFLVHEAGSQFEFLAHPLHSAGFFVALLGAPFTPTDPKIFVPMALLVGAVILVALLGALATLRSDECKELTTPWLSVALFGLLFAALVTAGRSARGLPYASQPRYITGTIFVSVAAIQLGRLAFARKRYYAYPFLVGALWSLLIPCSFGALSAAHDWREEHSQAKLFVELTRYLDPVTDGTPWNLASRMYGTKGVGGLAEILNDLGFLRLASNVSFLEHPCKDCGAFESADGSGSLLHLRQDKDMLSVSGWASLPQGRGLPKVVLISYGDRSTFIAGAVVGRVNRPDIAADRRDPRYFHAGWKVSFPAQFLPPGKGTLKAWLYDSAEKKFIRMPESGGEKEFDVEAR